MNQRAPQTPTQAAYERWRNQSDTPPGLQPTPEAAFEAAFLAGQVHALKEAAERIEFLWDGPMAEQVPFERSERALIEWLKTQAQKLCPVCVGWSVSGEEGRGGSCVGCGRVFLEPPRNPVCGAIHPLIGGGKPCVREYAHEGQHRVDELWWN